MKHIIALIACTTLVAAAGFRKVTQRTDEWGIFTVSIAVREAATDA